MPLLFYLKYLISSECFPALKAVQTIPLEPRVFFGLAKKVVSKSKNLRMDDSCIKLIFGGLNVQHLKCIICFQSREIIREEMRN